MLGGCSTRVFFDSGSAALGVRGEVSLRRFATIYRGEFFPTPSKMYVAIEGHTDSAGNDDQNLRLSMARARSVRGSLLQEGMSADRLVAMGCGSKRPMVGGPVNPDEPQNRNVLVKGELGGVNERASCKMVN
ncbi:OmpA family protein [Reyranella sp.]|uniref:OmpA family protein n=1 Tax=Reyranella sp. TaxID=1929291 RepID=UPI00352457BE